MTKTELKALLNDLDITPSRKLGQNFLVDENMLDAIIRHAAPEPGQHVIEVGPGTGVLTEKLLEKGCRVTAVECDRRLAEYLSARLRDNQRLTLLQADAARLDFEPIVGNDPYRCISNLPYSISTPLIMRLITIDNRPQDMLLLLQTEAAERFAAAPRTKAYGAPSVIVQHFYRPSIVRTLPGSVFYPEPEIGSALLELTPRDDVTGIEVPPSGTTAEIIRRLFIHRRKRLRKVLKTLTDNSTVDRLFDQLSIAPDTRAEELPPDRLWQLARQLETA